MNSLQISFAICALVLVLSAQTGQALKCHICNSHEIYEGEKCAELTEGSDSFLEDCNEYADKISAPEFKNATKCRKISQTIDGDYRIVRSCAVDGPSKCVERTGTKAVKVTYCQCEGDGCNSASAVITSITTLAVASIVAVFMRS